MVTVVQATESTTEETVLRAAEPEALRRYWLTAAGLRSRSEMTMVQHPGRDREASFRGDGGASHRLHD